MIDAIDRAAVQSAVRAYLVLENTAAAWEVERIIAALPAVYAPVAVRVKPLKWLAVDDDDCDFEAYSVGLRYWIVAVTDHQFTLSCGRLEIKHCLTLEAAKAAAQADYAARIMAAIDVVDVAELVEALRCLEIAATGAGVPHPQERKLLHGAIAAARAALARIGGQ